VREKILLRKRDFSEKLLAILQRRFDFTENLLLLKRDLTGGFSWVPGVPRKFISPDGDV
jgi:hypothetical protein